MFLASEQFLDFVLSVFSMIVSECDGVLYVVVTNLISGGSPK